MKGIAAQGNGSSLLWSAWEETLRRNKNRMVLIEATEGRSFTAQSLTDEALKLASSLANLKRGMRVAFCLPNGATWVSFFLALQKMGLGAVPLDATLPDQACLEMARNLRCHAVFVRGKLHTLDDAGKGNRSICCYKVTSGTSVGLPKTIACRAEHLLVDGTNIIRTMGIRPIDRNLVAIPLGHSYGLGNFVLPLILQGTSLVCASSFVPAQLISWIAQYHVTVFPSVPAIFRVLAALPGKSRLSPLRLAISAGAPLTAEIAQAFFDRYQLKIHNFYGSSETGGICYDRTGIATLTGRSVGKSLAGVTVTAHGGAVDVASAAVAKRGGRWRVPDLGKWNKQGELVLLGRRSRVANIGGKKVHPSEVERALRSVPGVMDAIVWVESVSERSFLVAAIETRLSLGELQNILSPKLPEWKSPKQYILTPEFPRTARGKVAMAVLREKMKMA